MPVFLFHGEDVYSQRKKLGFWQKEFEKKYGDINTTIFRDKGVTAQGILEACTTVPFLSEKRLTIVKNFLCQSESTQQAQLAEAIGNEEKSEIPEFCILVFWEEQPVDKRLSLYKKLMKFGKVEEFGPITGSKLLAWIEREVSSHGAVIEKDAQLFLSELVGSDLWRLENEIAKLVAYAGGKPINKAAVELLVTGQFTTSIFKLTDGIGQKNRRVVIETLHQLIETGEELHRILYMIMRQFRIITGVKDLLLQGKGRDAMVAELKEHPFVISNTISQAKNFSLEQLKGAYELLIEMDTKLKSGGIKILAGDNREFVLALDRLVLELCK